MTSNNDLVKRLRELARHQKWFPTEDTIAWLAADALEAAEAKLAKARETLQKIVERDPGFAPYDAWSWCYDTADAALKEIGEKE